MWMVAGETVNYLIDYLVDGEYVIPTSATATVRDNKGLPIAGLEDVQLDVDSTSTHLAIPAAANEVTPPSLFENRHIVVNFVHEGEPRQQNARYRIMPFVPMDATKPQVRRLLGLERSEVPDEEIDLHYAYLDLRTTHGVEIEDALTSGDERTLAINQAIAVRAAIELTYGLEFRAAVKIAAEGSQMVRMNQFDVDHIRNRLQQKLSGLLAGILDEELETSPILVLTFPADALTGV